MNIPLNNWFNASVAFVIKYKTLINQLIFISFLAFTIFIIVDLKDEWASFKWPDLLFNFNYVFLFVLTVIISYLIHSIGWQLVLRSMGSYINLRQAYICNLKSQIGKYVPGKIAILIAKINIANKYNVSYKKALASFSIEFALNILTLSLVGGVSLFFLIRQITYFDRIYLLTTLIIVIAISFLFILTPRNFTFILNRILVLLKKETFGLIHVKEYYKSLGILALGKITGGLGIFFLIKIIHPIGWGSDLIFVIGAWSIAYILGIAAIFAPAGIGVRDSILVYLFQFILPIQIAVASAILIRISMFVLELVLVLVAYILDR